MSVKELFEKILEEYPKTEGLVFTAMPPALKDDVLTRSITLLSSLKVNNELLLSSAQHKIEASVGKGNRASIPWIGIFDPKITQSASHGYYLVYLFSRKGNSVYLSLMFSSSDKLNIGKLESARNFVETLKNRPSDIIIGDIDLDSPTGIGKEYEKSTIASIRYEKGKIPNDEKLAEDLKRMLNLHDKYKEFTKGIQPTMGKNKMIEEIENYIKAKGFSYPKGMIENYFLSLKSKPFVILAGTSGTGKTRLVKLFAEAIGSTESNGRYKLVPVKPDWSDSTDLLGHLDLNGRFHVGEITDFIQSACNDSEHCYFLCLDEMNLARVEYYFSDLLSIMETKERTRDGRLESSKIFIDSAFRSDEEARKKYGSLILPQNLFIIGTVNMDETTFPFSKKVLDRANTIEFSYVDFKNEWNAGEDQRKVVDIQNSLIPEYLNLMDLRADQSYVDDISVVLNKINDVLYPAGLHFGYRVRDEISFYLENNKKFGMLTDNQAMDNEIMQKILPRIQGNSDMIQTALSGLFKICTGDYTEFNEESAVSKQMRQRLDNLEDVKYPNSANKIAFMLERMENDGFTSYWL